MALTNDICRMSGQGEMCDDTCPMLPNCRKPSPCDDCTTPMRQAMMYDEVDCYKTCKDWPGAKKANLLDPDDPSRKWDIAIKGNKIVSMMEVSHAERIGTQT